MAKARRKRRWIVRLSAAGLALTLAGAVMSEFGALSWRENTGGIANRFILYRSSVTVVCRFSPDDLDRMGRELFPAGWSYVRSLPPDAFVRSWIPECRYYGGAFVRTGHLALPLWIPAVLFGAALWWGLRGGWIGENACRGCGYDMSGLASGLCPECGRAA